MVNEIVLKEASKEIQGVQVLDKASYIFEHGKIYGISGRNGSGKTMLLRAISGLIHLSYGHVAIDGKILHKDIDYPDSIGVLIENPQFWKQYTGYEVLKLLASIKKTADVEDLKEALDRVGLDWHDRRTIRKYSLGMRQRLGIAQAIMEKPDIILLDEPTNALDKSGVDEIHKIINEESRRGALVIVASHDKEELEICDEVLVMDRGRIKADGEV